MKNEINEFKNICIGVACLIFGAICAIAGLFSLFGALLCGENIVGSLLICLIGAINVAIGVATGYFLGWFML